MHNPPMISRRRLFFVAAAAAALVGCGSATDDRPARWSFISATITEPMCATVNCHSAIAQRAHVDLHDRASGYRDLVGRGFVTLGDQTGSSPVLFLMNGQGSQRMPPDAPLPQADITLIQRWIAECQMPPCDD
jgi:hypothetical protein